MGLIGRSEEISRLHGLVSEVRQAGAALLLRGEPGIGKSALLQEAAAFAHASGLRVLGTTGVESEAHLPYAGLHQLLWPVRDRIGVLPPGQREALRAALGMTEAVVPEGYLVALAVLNLLAEIAEAAPVLIVAEDAHWLDPSTADVIAFLGRRLESEPILLLAATRPGTATRLDEAGLPDLLIPPLSAEDAAALLDVGAADLPASARRRLLAEAAGNPLALIELPAAVHGTDGAAILASPWLPLTARLESAFTRRFAALPAVTRAVLEVAALNDSADLNETLTATRGLTGRPVTAADLRPAVDARLLTPDESRVAFHHPLIRSAVHQAAGAARRRDVHRALAGALADQPDRRTWHLAAASDRPDEDIAAALEAVAVRAQRRGSGAAVVAALERAARLSPDPERRADRLLRAADGAVELGRPEIVDRLLSEAGEIEPSRQRRARLAWIRAAFDDGLREGSMDASALADLAESVAADGDIDLAVRILWSAALRCFWSEPGMAARDRIVDVAERLPLDPLDARLLAILGYAAPIARGAVVIERSERLLARSGLDSPTVRLVGSVAVLVGTFDVAITQSAASLAGLREQGRLQLLARALAAQAWAAAQLADLGVALPAAEEAGRLARETGQPFLLGLILATQAKIEALRGHFDQADELAAEAERLGTPVGARNVLATAQHARALAALGAGDYPQALTRLLRMHDITDPSHQLALSCHTVADIADAALRSERPGDVAGVITQMEAAAKTTTSPSLHDGLRMARAVLAGQDEAEGLFRTALAADLTRRPFIRARTELAYGEWLRRQRRAVESRQHLRAARDTFDALGTSPWGERARRELRAAGERSSERQAATSDLLTAQELQIAQMAAEGLTNREIGKRLYISHRTVGAHLARIYAKLGATSRVQLHDALGR
ncbi:ATP-binding protein [Actinoallomurus rhizosphaericola]|uniref:ATP-binding protein n=1 Tax=Actinoallomurus rhizosphaericola TaxID=2952536 RepID=UPI0020919EA8|nr:AAA family ATPase [Actinoallomurus rhizosphaericola]MCO5994137.1 AAA family ATPase [Actinoallomurus rhizosphaericola]